MPLTLTPDIEDVVGDYLRDVPELVALGAKVVGQSLGDSRVPWVRLTVLDAPSRSEPTDHFIEFYVQADCFAGKDATVAHAGQKQVNDLQSTVRAALRALPDAPLTGLVVTGVSVNRGPRMADDTVEPAREHIPVTASIWAHPA